MGSIAAAFDRSPENIESAKVPIRIISLSDTPEEFGKEITKNNNTQNRIDRRDFVALDENQERIRNELLLENVAYIYKSGDSLPPGTEGFDLVEATVALACSHSNFSYSVQAKREIGRLWDDISKAPYKALFHDGVSGPHLWRLVLLLRCIDGVLDHIANTQEGRARLCAIHGNRLISHIVFRQLSDGVVSGSGNLTQFESEEAAEISRESYEKVFAAIEEHYPDSYPASLFKNQTKCADIIEKASGQ